MKKNVVEISKSILVCVSANKKDIYRDIYGNMNGNGNGNRSWSERGTWQLYNNLPVGNCRNGANSNANSSTDSSSADK